MAAQNEGDMEYHVDPEGKFQAGQTMTMSEALARSRGDDMAVLDSLNREGENSQLGALFEYETA